MVSLFSVAAAQIPDDVEIPRNFKADLDTAARLRPSFVAASTPASIGYANGDAVFQRLTSQLPDEWQRKLAWQLRIVDDGQFNAYSSPDGSVYVEKNLARLAGASTGLWAAILSHEIAHVIRRDWARRDLFEKTLRNSSGTNIVLGDPGVTAPVWSSSEKASADLGRFCRRMEVEADREALGLMARAGYHPDFMPALHHLLQAKTGHEKGPSPYAMHPCWEERDHELRQAYADASIEFEHRWHEWYATPGGNPPVLVFTEEPRAKRVGQGEWEIKVPIRCQNLAGAVEVVLHSGLSTKTDQSGSGSDQRDSRQITGCTSPRTTVTLFVSDSVDHSSRGAWTDIYVLDAWGQVLARADLPKLH